MPIPEVFAWLSYAVTTSAWCWKLQLKDGTIYGFTTFNKNLIIDGITYEAATGIVPTAVDTSNNMAVDNLDVEGFLTSNRISEEDLAAGRFDFAKVEVFICNWSNLTDQKLIVRKGTLGRVKHTQNSFTAEARGMMEPYQQQAGKKCQKSCRADLGDSDCKVSMDEYTNTGTIIAVNSDGTLKTNLSRADAFFDYGVITFTTGQNANLGYEVKEYKQTDGFVDPFMPTTFPVSVGDEFIIVAGCDGNLSTCKNRFGNVINFRGEPYTPGNDYITSYPGQGTSNTVSSGQDPTRG